MDAQQQLIKEIGIPIEIKTMKIHGYTINYAVAGSGKPLVLVHALNIGWGEWYANIAKLAKHFTIYAIDLPGSGKSTKIDYEKMDFTKDYLEVVEKFITEKKLKNATLMGHSSGALIVLMIAQRKKVSVGKIVAISPIGFSDRLSFQYKLLSIRPLAKLLSKTAVKITRENVYAFLTQPMHNKYVSKEFANYYIQSINQRKESHPFLFLNRLLHRFKIKKDFLLANKGKIENKTLIITGDKDPNIPPLQPIQIKPFIPNVTIDVFHNCGHVPLIEHNKRFNEKVIQFII